MSRVNPDSLGQPRDDRDFYRRQIAAVTAMLKQPARKQAQPTAKPTRQPRKPTGAEMEYERVHLAQAAFDTCLRVVAQWPARWPVANGTHHYTPDFTVWRRAFSGWRLWEVHEVKGGFARATGKQRDSRVLFDAARAEYAWLGAEWVWAEKRADGKWTVERYGSDAAQRPQTGQGDVAGTTDGRGQAEGAANGAQGHR